MLLELKVKNFAIIDAIDVSFKSGFNVLSGETGSGKSILLKSLGLLMGDKSIADTIKSGCTQATVEGSFDLTKRRDIKMRLLNTGVTTAENEKQIEETLIVKRIISHDGKNRIYINGSLATLQQLRDIVSPLIELTGHAAPLIEMTGQHENRHLQSRTFHLEALDQYIGGGLKRIHIEELYTDIEKLKNKLADLESLAREKSQRLDFLTYQRDEIKNADLKAQDDMNIENEMRMVKESSRLSEFVNEAEACLYSDDDSALVRIHRILQKGHELTRIDTKLSDKIANLAQAKSLIEETVYNLRDYTQDLNSEPEQLEALEAKLSALRKLQKKYGPNVTDILAALKDIEHEIEHIENADSLIENIKAEIQTKNIELLKLSHELHKMRLGGATTLAKSVNSELEDLNMKGLIFSVQIQELNEPCATGMTDVEFMIQSSKKDSARSLAKYASGGELSRILLSLKRVVGMSELPRTYLFDEVDAGVSGVTAEKVGRKLKSIAKGQQVICVTHLPQVAAFSHAHFVISKSIDSKGAVAMQVEELAPKEKVQEIARMLSGERITKSSLEHAKELLKN